MRLLVSLASNNIAFIILLFAVPYFKCQSFDDISENVHMSPMLTEEIEVEEGTTSNLFAPPQDVCYGNLGCFSSKGVFNDRRHRPIQRKPQSPLIVNTRFFLFTRMNAKKTRILKYHEPASIKNSKFSSKNPTLFIVHGFLASGNSKWMHAIKNEILKLKEANVIIVDWGGGSQMPYSQAAINTRVVGAVIARLVRWIEKHTGADRNNFHLIGHSLGAHVCGYAGHRLRERNKQLGRITGLDPAEPYFQYTHNDVRLDPSDATFVDVIHTDGESIAKGVFTVSGGLGLSQPVGHLDFYPNGGMNQPGCTKTNFWKSLNKGIGKAFSDMTTCDHSRAYHLFIESLKLSDKSFRAFECSDYSTFKQGQCVACSKDDCPKMGVDSHKWNGLNGRNRVKLFFFTSNQASYLLFHYFVVITLSAEQDQDNINADFFIKMKDSKGQVTKELKVVEETDMEPSKTYQTLLTSSVDLIDLTSIELKWINNDWSWSNKFISLHLINVLFADNQKKYLFNVSDRKLQSKQILTLQYTN